MNKQEATHHEGQLLGACLKNPPAKQKLQWNCLTGAEAAPEPTAGSPKALPALGLAVRRPPQRLRLVPAGQTWEMLPRADFT